MHFRHLLYVALGLVLCAGCGSKLGSVSGKVQLDGKPLPNAIVTFMPVGGGSSGSATTDAEGNYKLNSVAADGLEPGKYKVAITSAQAGKAVAEEIDMNSPEYLAMSSGVGMESAKSKAPKEKIPARYNSATVLQEDVPAGPITLNFELKSK